MATKSVLDQWADREVIPAAEITRVADLPRMALYHAHDRGLIDDVRRAPNGRLLLTREDAIMVLAAAAIMVTAGIVFAAAYRAAQAVASQAGREAIAAMAAKTLSNTTT